MGGEVITDIDVVGAIVPRARQVVYFGEEMTAEELYKVVTMAVMDSERKPTVISISWGWPEDQVPWQVSWGMRRLFKKAALLGITMCVATSDYGSLDIDRESSAAKKNKGRLHVDFPACLEASLACGGTWFTSEGEVTWNEGNGRATGGGISEIIPMPAYQNNAGVPHRENGKTGRGVPDVLGIAKHHTFIQKGEVMHASGTSFVAPMWAGLIARLNQALGKPVGFINPILYDNPKAFQVIAKGHNDVRPFPKQEKDPPYKYKAEPKWDPATGLGIPRGEALLQAVQTWNPGSDVKAPKADK
jgi:kumamolisin